MKIIIEDAGDFHEAVSLGMCHYKENNCPESLLKIGYSKILTELLIPMKCYLKKIL